MLLAVVLLFVVGGCLLVVSNVVCCWLFVEWLLIMIFVVDWLYMVLLVLVLNPPLQHCSAIMTTVQAPAMMMALQNKELDNARECELPKSFANEI